MDNEIEYDEYDDTPDEPTQPEQRRQPEPGWRRKLEREAQEGRRAQAEAAAAKRELAMLRAGIDLDSPAGKLFAKAYDGDPTADAVKAAAVEYGLLQSDEDKAAMQDEIAAHERMSAAVPATGPAPTAEEQAIDAIRNAPFGDVNAVLQALQKAGVTIEDGQPGGWLHTPNGSVASTTPLS